MRALNKSAEKESSALQKIFLIKTLPPPPPGLKLFSEADSNLSSKGEGVRLIYLLGSEVGGASAAGGGAGGCSACCHTGISV